MRAKSVVGGVICAGILAFVAGECVAQGFGERLSDGFQDLGRGMKRGVQDVGDGVKRQFDHVRTDVHRMETHSRVYSRLHWEQSLHGSKVEVYMLRDGTALLVGTVPDQAAKERAVEIVRNTVGITAVIDELHPIIAEKPIAEKPVPATSSTSSASGTKRTR